MIYDFNNFLNIELQIENNNFKNICKQLEFNLEFLNKIKILKNCILSINGNNFAMVTIYKNYYKLEQLHGIQTYYIYRL